MDTTWNVNYGPRAIEALVETAQVESWTRALIVCGKRSFESSGAARILEPLRQHANVVTFDDFAPNTDADDLLVGLRRLDAQPADAVIGIGGGSAMDMAKLLVAFEGITERDALHDAIRSQRIRPRARRLMLAPTTSGSGSEATHFAVAYIGADKFSVAGPELRADKIFLDPLLSMSGSPAQRATSGIDAVCQATESLWAVGATPSSRRNASWALTYLIPSIRRFVHQPDEASARAMAIGSHLAGRAIDVSKTTAAHALSYRMTKRFGVSHGNAVALTLGQFIDIHDTAGADELQSAVEPAQHQRAMRQLRRRFGLADGESGSAAIRSLLDDLELTAGLGELGASDADIDELVEAVNIERLGNNPVVLSIDDLRTVVAGAL
jgi:alcohol dehydrogenase class IV